jgi:hypothetical protein
MFEHLRYRAGVQTRSPTGELAERVLMLNDEGSVEDREFVLGVIAALEEKKRRLQETIRRQLWPLGLCHGAAAGRGQDVSRGGGLPAARAEL